MTEQFQCNFRAISEQFQSNFRAISEQQLIRLNLNQLNKTNLTMQLTLNATRAVSEQFPSSFRATVHSIQCKLKRFNPNLTIIMTTTSIASDFRQI